MGIADGQVGALQNVIVHGARDTHWNWVIVAEGYHWLERPKFDADVSALRNHIEDVLTTGNFAGSGCWKRINLYKLPISSTDSGADNDDPRGCDHPVARATYLDARYCYGNVRRWLVVNNKLALTTVEQQLLHYNQIIVLVNGQLSGGSGGPGGNCAVVATPPGRAWWFRAMHEIGHTAFGLGDEYSENPGPPPSPSPTVYPNVTTQDELAAGGKWIPDPNILTPTTVNQGCNHQAAPNVLPILASTVGAFEGAGRYTCDLYRSQLDCRMRTSSDNIPFCDVCAAEIRQDLL